MKDISTPVSGADFQCHLYSLTISEGGMVELEGCAFTTLEGWKSRIVGLRVSRPGSNPLEFDIQRFRDNRANTIAKDGRTDQSFSNFYARIDLRSLGDSSGDHNFNHKWKIEAVLESKRGKLHSTNHVNVSSWVKGGVVQFNQAEYMDFDVLVQASWHDGVILNIARKAVMAESFQIDGSRIHLKLRLNDFDGDYICLSSGDRIFAESRLQNAEDRSFSATLDLSNVPDEHTESVYFVVKDDVGRKRFVHYAPNDGMFMRRIMARPEYYLSRTPRSLLRIDRSDDIVVIDSLSVSGPSTLEAQGWTDLPVEDLCLRLVSSRSESRTVVAEQSGTGRFSVHIPLVNTREQLPLPPGSYKLEACCTDRRLSFSAQVGSRLLSDLGTLSGTKYIDTSASISKNGQLTVKIRSNLTEFERSEYGRAVTRRVSHKFKTEADTALFEVFNGRSSGDNPRPIFERLLARRPDLQVRWAVADLSVPVPAGTEPVVIHSSEYYRMVNSSELFITNNWLPPQSVARDSQRILQTWHGTPLKTLGLDRFHSGSDRQRKRMREMTSLWDALISQNPYSSEIFRSCYAYGGPVLETGYPRNDILVNGAPKKLIASTRKSLGIRDGQRVLLYMPTWRENEKSIFSELDLSRLKKELGDEWVVLVRGHAMNSKSRSTFSTAGIVDVSTVNDPAILYLLANVLVTDYSSSMFDFTITGKPVAFFVPDIERYRDELRGMYFDLSKSAPGPLVSTTNELIEVVQSLPSVTGEFKEKYELWRTEYNPWDDGRATERVVEFLMTGRDSIL